ncbi:MAG: isochorismatase family protein [Ruminiclostridium sp.]|nr:isochorismatase family protein [Ruminiclostridium sp.]
MVIDMQNDYLYEKRKPIFAYNTEELVGNVNGLIQEYREKGCDIIYIRHIIQNLPTNRLLFGYSLAGTEGAELYSGLDIVSDYVFDKLLGDALSNKELLKLVREKEYDSLCLCGLDECGCVTSTALGAAKRGIKAEIIRKGTATVFPQKKINKARKKLGKAGVSYV